MGNRLGLGVHWERIRSVFQCELWCRLDAEFSAEDDPVRNSELHASTWTAVKTVALTLVQEEFLKTEIKHEEEVEEAHLTEEEKREVH